MNLAIMYALLSVSCTVCSQLLLKRYANKTIGLSFIRYYTKPSILISYVLLFLSTILNMYAYKQLPLSMAAFFLPLTFFSVIILSCLLLKERLCLRQICALLLMLLGLLLFSV